MQAQIEDVAAKDAATPDLKRHMTGLITHQKLAESGRDYANETQLKCICC